MPKPGEFIPSLKGENKIDYCIRVSKMYGLKELAEFGFQVMESRAKGRKIPLWSQIGDMYGHCAMVSQLMERRFRELLGLVEVKKKLKKRKRGRGR